MAFFADLLKKWFYTNSSSAASSDARIPLLTATGEPKGSDTMANLASVLGVGNAINVHFSGDLNDFVTPMPPTLLYSPSKNAQNVPQNMGDTSFFLSVSLSWTNNRHYDSDKRILQELYAIETNILYHRIKNGSGWSGWKEITTDMPSFYKDYADLDALASALEVTMSRRTRLTDFDLATLKQAVADQNLEKYGLKVGDQKTINGRTYVIAGLNPMKGAATPYRLTQNHVGLIVIPHTTQKWNESGNTYTGAGGRGAGYANSDLHYYLINTLLPLVQGDLGSGNLLAHSKLLGNAVNTSGYNRIGSASGCTSGWGWVSNQYISALSEVQVYGATVWSSSGYDTGEACRQLDVFRHFNHTEIFGGEYPWLRDVVSASHAAYADSTGNANVSTASYAYYVAALILFK